MNLLSSLSRFVRTNWPPALEQFINGLANFGPGIGTIGTGHRRFAVQDFISSGPLDSWLGVAVHPVQLPQVAGRTRTFGLVVLEVEPGSPAANASLLPGDILLGTEEKPFTSIDDLSQILGRRGPRLERFEFLRGDYLRVRRFSVQLGGGFVFGSGIAA